MNLLALTPEEINVVLSATSAKMNFNTNVVEKDWWVTMVLKALFFQTFSKAWASAGLRLGMAFASPEIIAVYNKVKYPYNVNLQTQQLMLAHLQEPQRIRAWVEELIEQRSFLQQALAALPIVQHIYPSDANFLLVKVDDADALYQYLVAQGIIVRNRNRVRLCEGCLRITVGTADENAALMAAMQQFINL